MAGLKARGLNVPESANGIKNTVFKYADTIREEVKTEIANKIRDGKRFSLSLDEYTSIKNQRYVCMNLHDGSTTTSLGMVRVKGSLPAEKAVELIIARAEEFGLNLKRHIVGIITDGAAMMKKIARLLEIEQQLMERI